MNTGIGRDGYSIIGQGKIAEIISRKSDERRSIFEDASGIAKYRHRKTETERKLKTTEENMTRVNDVFQEVEAQVGPLEKEAERAKKAIELHETKKKADVQLWLFDSERLRADTEKAEESFRNSSYDLKIAEETIENYKTQSDQLFEESQANKAKAADLLERIRELTQENHDRDSQYHVTETNIANMREKIEGARERLSRKEEQLAAEQETGARRRAEWEGHKARLDELEAAHTAKAEQAQALTDRAFALAGDVSRAFADITDREAESTEIRVRMQVLETSKQTDSGKNDAMIAEIAEYRAVSDQYAKAVAEKERVVANYQAQIDEADGVLAGFDEKLEKMNTELHALTEHENESKLEADLARQRMEAFRAMEEHFEGYSHSVRFVMEAYANGRITDAAGRKCGRIYGPLSKVISVDQKHVVAIETALGVNLQHIVVEDESVAKAAIYALKKAEAGRATFFPISSMRGLTVTAEMEEAEECRGYLGIASELVDCEDKFREVVSSLLGRTVVFDSLDNATEMARRTKFRVKVVTLDGQVINAGGSFSGGSVKQRAGVLSRTGEIAALNEKLKKLNAELAECRTKREVLEKQIATLADEREDADSRRQLLAAMQSSEAGELSALQAKLDANNALTEKLDADFEALGRQRAGYDEELARLAEQQKMLAHQIEEIGALRAEKDLARNAVLEQKTDIDAEMTELYIRISGVRKDMETVEVYRNESDARADAIRADMEDAKARITELEEEVKRNVLRQEANRNTFDEGNRVLRELSDRHALLQEGDLAFEKKLSEINAKLHNKMAEKENIFRAHTLNENRLNSLRAEQDKIAAKFWEDYEMSRTDALALGYEPITAEERAAVAELQTSCRNRLRAIGNVDLDAVNKYKDVKERYDYMAGQIADMTAARDDLLKIIRELESEMKTAFVTTFEQINQNFDRTFKELFGGGSAELSLSDPEDVLTSGIEIKAAPPGKIIKNLVQLSGGEQSFIAIALFFAILQVNPTPFFILDEIEAALDEVNVARFAAYIKRYSLDTQFILITHRRGTMEAANRLYGVTMPERGISKVLTLDVASIRGKQEGDDWNGIFG